MHPIYTAAASQANNCSSNVEVTVVGAIVIAVVVLLICWANRNNN